jgi:predicted HAD superfamily Cof-like phosphohydrolase
MHNDIINDIFDFNEQVIGTADQPLNPLTEAQHEWTHKFCNEELTEFREAFEAQDIVKMVDAIGDLIYGAMGTFKKMGLTRAQVHAVFAAIHAANMTKKKGRTARGSDEDAAKPADFVPPDEVIGRLLFPTEYDDGDKGGEFGGCAA